MSARGSNFRQTDPQIPASLHRILADNAIDIDGRSWRVLVGYGSPEHASLYCAELGPGDRVLSKISSNISVTMIEPDSKSSGVARYPCSHAHLRKALASRGEDVIIVFPHALPIP